MIGCDLPNGYGFFCDDDLCHENDSLTACVLMTDCDWPNGYDSVYVDY
jgi:hypothetical protein